MIGRSASVLFIEQMSPLLASARQQTRLVSRNWTARWRQSYRALSSAPETPPAGSSGSPRPAEPQPQQISREEAQGRAHQILQYFPGNTLARKATYATIVSGLTAFLVANGIYIPNDETLILAAFVIVSRFLYVKLSAPVAALLDGAIDEVRTRLSASRSHQLQSAIVEIGQLEGLRDFALVNESLLQTQSENIVLEAQLTELQEQGKFLAGIKAQLDERVRRAGEERVAQRRALVDAIMAGVMKELRDPQMQERILKKSIADLQKVSLATPQP